MFCVSIVVSINDVHCVFLFILLPARRAQEADAGAGVSAAGAGGAEGEVGADAA